MLPLLSFFIITLCLISTVNMPFDPGLVDRTIQQNRDGFYPWPFYKDNNHSLTIENKQTDEIKQDVYNFSYQYLNITNTYQYVIQSMTFLCRILQNNILFHSINNNTTQLLEQQDNILIIFVNTIAKLFNFAKYIVMEKPLLILYFNGPAWHGWGFWSSKEYHDICSELTGVSAKHWYEQKQECEKLIQKHAWAFVVFVEVVLYFLCIYKILQYALFKWYIVNPLITRLQRDSMLIHPQTLDIQKKKKN